VPSEACGQLAIDSRTANVLGSTHMEKGSGCEPLLEADYQALRYPKWQAKGYTTDGGGGGATASSARPSKTISTCQPGSQFLRKLFR